MDAINDEASKNYNDKVLDACPNCGRTFLPDRLVVHLRSCKGPISGKQGPTNNSMSPQIGGGKFA